MAITIGDAVIWLRGKDEKLDGDLKKTEGKVKGWVGRIAGSVKESMNFAVGQIMSQGLNQLAYGIENMARETIQLGQEYAQQVEDLARLSGASVEDASRIIQVADDMRLNYGDLSTALKMYAKTQQEAGGASKLSIDQLAGLADQYLQLAPGVERANFLLSNFGRSGLEMGKIMEQGGQKIRDMAGSVDESLVMTQEGITAAEKYRLAMDELNDKMMGVKLRLANVLFPYLERFAIWLIDEGIPKLERFVIWFTKLPEPVQKVAFGLGGLLLLLVKLGPMLMGIAGIISMLGGAGAGGGLMGGLAAAVGAVSLPVLALVAAIGALIAVLVIFGAQAKNTLSMIGQLFAAAFKRSLFEVNKFGQQFGNWVRSLGPKVTGWFKSIGTNIVNGIKSGITSAWSLLKSSLSSSITDLLAWIKSKLNIDSPSLVFATEVGAPMAQGIGLGFQKSLQAEVSQMVSVGLQGLATTAASSQNISVGQLIVDSRMAQRERDEFDRRSKRIAERSMLSWIERYGTP